MGDNVATLDGYTRECHGTGFVAGGDRRELFLLVRPGTSMGDQFKAWDMDNQEYVTVSGYTPGHGVDVGPLLSGDRADVTAAELAELVRLARIGAAVVARPHGFDFGAECGVSACEECHMPFYPMELESGDECPECLAHAVRPLRVRE